MLSWVSNGISSDQKVGIWARLIGLNWGRSGGGGNDRRPGVVQHPNTCAVTSSRKQAAAAHWQPVQLLLPPRLQFYITLTPTPHLDGKHVVFGAVEAGWSTLMMMESEGTDSGNVTTPVTILDCRELDLSVDPEAAVREMEQAQREQQMAAEFAAEFDAAAKAEGGEQQPQQQQQQEEAAPASS